MSDHGRRQLVREFNLHALELHAALADEASPQASLAENFSPGEGPVSDSMPLFVHPQLERRPDR